MRILITGGAGYIGTELAHLLIENEAVEHVTIYDNLSRNNYNLFIEEELKSGKISFYHGDILDGRNLRKALDNIDVVYHLAAIVTTPYADQELHQYEQVNHWGTAELVECIQETNVSQIIFLSSASVYGFSEEYMDEDSKTNPTNHYGIAKKRAEQEIKLLSKTRKVTIIRSANVFGYSRSMRFDSVINRFMFDANFNGRVNVFGDGRQNRAFISIDFLSHILSNLIFDKEFPTVLNAVEFNFGVNEIIFEYLKKVYPETEVLYVNQEIPVKGIKLKSKFNVREYKSFVHQDFETYLNNFKFKFSFR
ncbi:NAD-dependent epimerase/dehydratase family protein [Gelidibacter japonicus]|uniref:NAD-dependent epimerase/dehydratase family protein n=1 Tax=Gelidibacter japonicus TaxID=1962232 RepID=UPI003A902147